MSDRWRTMKWGDLAVLEYGKALGGYKDSRHAAARVFGTNGPIGWTCEALGGGPTVIVGRKGAYRGVHYSPGPFWVIDTAYWLRPIDEIDMRWAYYQLLTQDINARDSGSAIPSLSRGDFYALPVLLPPTSEQRAIAEVLGALDDKIECNTKVARKAQELAGAVWALSYRSSVGVATETTLGQLVDVGALYFSDGYRTKQSELGDPGVPVLRVADVLDGRVMLTRRDRVLEELRAKFARKVSLPGDVVLTTKGTIGRVAMIPRSMPEFIYSPQLCFFRVLPGSSLDCSWLYGWFRGSQFRERAAAVQHQTDMAPYINLADLRGMRITLPPPEIQRHIGDLISQLEDTAQAAFCESEALASMRDMLLPRLLSGELRIRDTEALVGEAV